MDKKQAQATEILLILSYHTPSKLTWRLHGTLIFNRHITDRWALL
jgi:hypothetical protein